MSIKKPCAYCGRPSNKRDREHVFPKNLYPESKAKSKTQRLTIPACKECNNSWSDDEAHFRNMLVIAGDPATPARNELFYTTVKRSFNQPDGFKRIKDLLEKMELTVLDGKDRYRVFPGKDERVIRVIKKIVKGLHYYHGLRWPLLDKNILVDVLKYQIPEEFLNEMDFHHRDIDIVEYRYSQLDQEGVESAWIITFYQSVTFIAIVSKSEELIIER